MIDQLSGKIRTMPEEKAYYENFSTCMQLNLVNPEFSGYQNKNSPLTHTKALHVYVFGLNLMSEK